MAKTKNSRIRSQSEYRYTNFQYEKQIFDAEKLKDNIFAIEKLHEERDIAFAETIELRDELTEVHTKYHKLELQKRESDIKLTEASKRLEKISDLEKQIEDLKTQHHLLELEKQESKLKLNEAIQKLSAAKK